MPSMMVTTRGSVLRLIRWQWRKVLLFLVTASVVYYVHDARGVSWFKLPLPPLAIVGAALGIFVGFRTNSSYDRWWEARRLWGQIVNASRAFASQVLAYLPGPGPDEGPGEASALQRALVLRQVAWSHALRCALRDQDVLADEDLRRLLTEPERLALRGESNAAHALLHAQLGALAACADRGELTELRLASIDRTVIALLDAQGGCERIKRTPMPRSYGFIADRLIVTFGCLLPLGLVGGLDLAIIPLNVVICLSFALISEAGRVIEDPFTLFWDGLPLHSLSTLIEINLRTRLGDRDLPRPVAVDPDGILM